ncbi:tryptophan 2,3-dioxygenase [Ktedonosporobacter rubrisoli]|uniref:Tryptophan 2,3-dioxygenase n=2 Tax=Ktedonosporobacter rubrisoli TaxID=2509675 RepID=A0A4P6JWU8_KTERU|nr:tryptophan 2,3-dioxygenase [Ktedonosporobacter rubrisoli]
MSQALTYTSYLRLNELLDLQTPRSAGLHGPEHDELLFIVTHQVYELWFKVLLHELDALKEHLNTNETARILHTSSRILKILKTIVAQIDVLETMTPLEFNAFRSLLGSASGFQSSQFREIEFVLGYKREAILHHYPDEMASKKGLEERYQQPAVWDAFLHYLTLNGYTLPEEQLQRDVKESLKPSEQLQALLIEAYRYNAEVRNVCERLLDIDEGLQEWRYRHVKMVERTIGQKPGTGGSTGSRYLSTTLRPIFPDLWAIRSQL